MAKIKGVQVSATISPELNDALENHRWDVRKTKAEVIKQAIEEYADRNSFTPTSDADSAAETGAVNETA